MANPKITKTCVRFAFIECASGKNLNEEQVEELNYLIGKDWDFIHNRNEEEIGVFDDIKLSEAIPVADTYGGSSVRDLFWFILMRQLKRRNQTQDNNTVPVEDGFKKTVAELATIIFEIIQGQQT